MRRSKSEYEVLRERARSLRVYECLPITLIAKRLDVPRATVGDWCKGLGETAFYRDCKHCGEQFLSISLNNSVCSKKCVKRRKPIQTGKCDLCKAEFVKKCRTHRFCSPAHSNKWWQVYGRRAA